MLKNEQNLKKGESHFPGQQEDLGHDGVLFARHHPMQWRTLNPFKHKAYIFSSPWLLAAAGGLLILIVVTFAFHNLRLEERLMTNAMVQKAATLSRVLHSGVRASFMNDLRNHEWNREAWPQHVQRVVDHLSEDSELLFFMIVDANGKIIVAKDSSLIGTQADVPGLGQVMAINEHSQERQMLYGIRKRASFGRVFETISPFVLIFPPPPPPGERSLFMPPHGNHFMFRLGPENPPQGMPYFVVIGQSMKDFDKTMRRLRMQILMLSLAMLFVGLGGWFSLSAVQGFRISQKTLNDMQAFTSLLIAKLPVGVIATDRGGRITTWNGAISQLIGLKSGQATGRRPADILPEQLVRFFTVPGKDAMEEEAGNREAQVRLQLGERRCELLCHPLTIFDSQQQYMGQVLLISDVTEIRSLEQRMRENERLAAVGRMAGGVAHEVRNPLSSIKGLALLLKNKFPAGSKEQDTAELLIQETERMNRTITEMLSFTRPSVLNLKRVDLKQLLEKSRFLLEAEAAENHIAIRLQAAEGLQPVLGDADRLQQVIMNVLINGMQAMHEGGTLTMDLKNSTDPGMVELRITDTGAGIAPDLLGQVFYPYFTTKQGGTGLGLAISQKIIIDHGGTIALESDPGKGTTVLIELPAWKEQPPQITTA